MKLELVSKVKQFKAEYNKEWITCNNLEVFNRNRIINPDKWGKLFEYNVYCWVDITKPINLNIGFGINLKYSPVYIGKGTFGSDIFKWRAFNHRNDLLEKVITTTPENYKCIVIAEGITNDEALSLESYTINHLIKQGYKLTKGNNFNSKKDRLINKRREFGWYRKSYKYLNYNNQWK